MKKGMFLFVIGLLISCSKSSTAPITQSYVSFYANGVSSVINGPFGYTNPTGVLFGYQQKNNDTTSFFFSGGDKFVLQLYVYIPVQLPLNIKLNLFKKYSYYADTDYSDIDSMRNLFLLDTTQSYITFTEIDNAKISGTFACQGANNIGKSVSITQGKFTVFR